jgi:hypothetical protein
MRELYIYYRIREGAAEQAGAAVRMMQRELRAAHPGLVARLLTRGGASGTATWMEAYALREAAASAGVDARIEGAIAEGALALAPFIDGSRHVEAFEGEEPR